MIEYAKINDFVICAAQDEMGNHDCFYVCDKNMERVTTTRFEFAAQAIEWANKNYKRILDV